MKDDMLFGSKQAGPSIDVMKYDSAECPKCGNKYFRSVYMIKKIPALEVGAGSGTIEYPIPCLVCDKCGEEYTQDENTNSLIME